MANFSDRDVGNRYLKHMTSTDWKRPTRIRYKGGIRAAVLREVQNHAAAIRWLSRNPTTRKYYDVYQLRYDALMRARIGAHDGIRIPTFGGTPRVAADEPWRGSFARRIKRANVAPNDRKGLAAFEAKESAEALARFREWENSKQRVLLDR